MAKHGDDRTGNLVCSFCEKSQDEVRKLIAGPTVYICDECIDLCNDIIAEKGDRREALQGTASAASSLRLAEWCRVCRRRRAAPELVAVPDVGHVCHRCVDAIRATVDAPKPE